ncbi:E3 ubiquitin-protein ligase TM129-like [Eulemur rufifrons]|uniref:E3 ubiquitin-protein ligase TM129-like n=1 Tax=Eulemur rufifrons TaxID=859984 RepID=UPI003742E79D
MNSPEMTFTLAHLVFAMCFVFTPNEFHSTRLTVENLMSGWLGSQDAAFVSFHLRSTAATLLGHSLLALGEALPASSLPGTGTRKPRASSCDSLATWGKHAFCS